MAIAKVILNGEVQMDVTSDTVEANKLLEGETATKNDGTKVTGTFVAPDPVISSLSVTPTESAQTFNDASISGYKPVTIGAIASDYIGSAVPMRSDVNLTGLETYSGYKVQAQQGYYSQTASYNISAASINISGPYFTYSLGYFSGAVNIITSGYAKQRSYSFSQQLSTLSSQTITPSSESQYIPANRWLTGSQTIAPINITSLSVTPTEEQQVFDGTTESLVQTGSSLAGSAERPTLSLAVGQQYILRLIDAEDTMGYSCIDSIDEKEYTFTWDGQEKTHSFQGYGTNGISIRITENNTIFISSYRGIEYISWELYVENMVDGYLPVTVNAIPSSYIIPSGTYSVTENGIYNIGSYASVDVSVSGGGLTVDDMAMRTISGVFEGAEATYISSYAFCQYDTITMASFPNVGSIGAYAFSNCNALISISFPSLTYIDYGAFSYCTALASVDLSLVSYIGAGAFRNCESLTSVNFPEALIIGGQAFYSCSRLNTINFPEATNIGSYAFCTDEQIRIIDFPEATNIGSYAFCSCRYISQISFPKAITIGEYAFYNASYQSFIADFPCATDIGASAFGACMGAIKSISFPEVINIGAYTFYGTYLASLSAYFPKATSVGSYAFSGTMITAADFPKLESITGGAFYHAYKLSLLNFPALQYIGYEAFSGCTSLTSVSFPNVTVIGASAFANCQSLQSMNFPKATTISTYAFSHCGSLSIIDFPEVTTISNSAFYSCSGITLVSLPKLITLGSSAFAATMTNEYAIVNLPLLSRIESCVFYNCFSLSTAIFSELSYITRSAFAFCSNLISLYLLGSSVVSLGNSLAFNGTPLLSSSVIGQWGSIYVPSSLYDSYISSVTWSYYFASRIVGLTDEQMDPIIHCGSMVHAGQMVSSSAQYTMYAATDTFSYYLTTDSTYVLFDRLKYKDTNGSYHLIANTPGVSFVASVNESLPHKSTGDVTYAVGAAFDHAAFLWQLSDGITDVSEVICDYTICEYNA